MTGKKIAFLMDSPFTCGGEQRVVTSVANLLCLQGYNISIICTRYNNKKSDIYNLNEEVKIIDVSTNTTIDEFVLKINNKLRKINSKFHCLPKCVIKKLMLTRRIRKNIFRKIKENNFDFVIGVASLYSLFLATYRNKISTETKIIGWQHNNFNAYFNTKGRRLYNEKKIFKKYANNFYKYIVLMNDDKLKMDKFFNMSCTKIFNPLSFDSNNIKKLKQEKFVFVGRIENVKGVDLLLEAYKKYIELGGYWKLDIVGDGSKKNDLMNKAKFLKIDDCVNFVGFTTNVQDYLSESMVSLIPSRWEGFGLVLTESMQLGLPAICFRLLPFEEITEGFSSCVFVKPYDVDDFAKEMIKLSSDKECIIRMSSEAEKNARIFEGKTIVKEWMKILEEIGDCDENRKIN